MRHVITIMFIVFLASACSNERTPQPTPKQEQAAPATAPTKPSPDIKFERVTVPPKNSYKNPKF